MATVAKGHIERLPSGSFRVRVYAGTDPVTRREIRLKQTVKDETAAAAALGELLKKAQAQRFPDQSATLGTLLDRYLDTADHALNTSETNKSFIRRIIKPALGYVLLRRLRPDMLDTLYAHLRKCSKLCGGKARIDHRTSRPHDCDHRCKPHVCKPMAPASVVRIHAIISAALSLADRYGWVGENVAAKASPPRSRRREPEPPNPKEAARLLNLVWDEDPEFALFLWLAMTTGARRGELVALREHRIDFEALCLKVARSYVVRGGKRQEKEPKSGESRPLSLDPLDAQLVQAHLRRRREAASAAGAEIPEDAFVFSPDPLGGCPWNPDTMTHRYERYARRVGITSSLKELRHYSASQLLSNGVDLRTVAGRIGHADGGVTTLRFYAQFIRPADQQAASFLAAQLDGLRKRERLWELFSQLPATHPGGLEQLATDLGSQAGLDEATALAYLTQFSAEQAGATPGNPASKPHSAGR
jgi:integrase